MQRRRKRYAKEGYNNENKLHFSMPAAPLNKQLHFFSNPISLAAICWQKIAQKHLKFAV
jgi:hypothetical protein